MKEVGVACEGDSDDLPRGGSGRERRPVLIRTSIGRSQVGWIGGLQIPQSGYFGVWIKENMSIEAK